MNAPALRIDSSHLPRYALIALLALLCACGEKDDEEGDAGGTDGDTDADTDADSDADGDGDSDADGDGCGFPVGGAAGAAGIAPQESREHDSQSGSAMNTVELDMGGQLAADGPESLAFGPCGDAGLLFWHSDGSDWSRHYVDPTTTDSPETIFSGGSLNDAALFFDEDCTPVILAEGGSDWVEEWARDGGWSVTTSASLPTELGGSVSSFNIIDSHTSPDGSFHVFLQVYLDSVATLVRGDRDAAASSPWSFTALPAPEASEIHAYRVDADGHTHAVFHNTDYPCDPCDVSLYHGELESPTGTWAVATVHEGVWGPPHDELIESADLAFDSQGNAYVAAHFSQRVITGSYVYTELRLFGDADGTWCDEQVTSANDGYAGTDGDTFTGALPRMRIDADDRVHVLYLDQAVWHDGQNWQNTMHGQLRYGLFSGGVWSRATLLSQDGQTQSADPLLGTRGHRLAVSPDGSQVVAAGVVQSWETDSIYNDSDVPATHVLTSVAADITAP